MAAPFVCASQAIAELVGINLFAYLCPYRTPYIRTPLLAVWRNHHQQSSNPKLKQPLLLPPLPLPSPSSPISSSFSTTNMNMTDVELRQRLQTSEYNEGLLLIKWINSLDVVERLSDPGLASFPSGQCLLQSAPWAIYRNTPMVAAAAANMMTASLFIAERTEVDTILSLAVKHPSYKQMAVILRLSVSNDVLRACSTSTRKMLAHHLVNAIGRGLKSNGMVHIRGPIVTAHPVTNQQLYRRDCWLEETVQGKVRHQEVLFTYGY